MTRESYKIPAPTTKNKREAIRKGMLPLLLVLSLAVPSHLSGAELRTWTSEAGSTVEAEFLRFHDGRVYLKRTDGSNIAIYLNSLSVADREYVNSLGSTSAVSQGGRKTARPRPNVPLGHEDYIPSRDNPIGWRGDGTSRYIGAEPPTEWNTATDKNILWKIPMPSWSHAAPIVVNPASGGPARVIVLSEPHSILCYDADTGNKLWHNATDVFDIVCASPAEAKAKRELWEKIELGYSIGRDNYNKPNLEMYGPIERALGEKCRDALKGTEYWEKDGPEPWVVKLPLDFLKLGAQINGHVNAVGRTQAPAVSDGTFVWAGFGSNCVLCYDLATGKAVWTRFFGGWSSKEEWKTVFGKQENVEEAFKPAPQIVDNKLLIVYAYIMRALDPDSGKILWETPVPRTDPSPPGFKKSGHKGAGTSVALNVDGLWVAVTPRGQVVRLSDGKRLESLPAWMDGAGTSPVADDATDTVFFFDGTCGGRGNTEQTYAIRLTRNQDNISSKIIWKTPDTACERNSILHDGRLYGPDAGILDAETGQILHELHKKFHPSYGAWMLAGNTLFGCSKGQTRDNLNNPMISFTIYTVNSDGSPDRQRTEAVIQETESTDDLHQRMVQAWKDGILSWRTPSSVWFHTVIGPNVIMGNLPAFHGKRMYIRTYAYLYCIGEK